MLRVMLLVALLGGTVSGWAQTVTVFAAASLKDALDEITADYARGGGSKAVISYASSSVLAKQIESGAPADLFISADLDWMDYVATRKLINPDTRVNLLGNKLVLIAPANSGIKTKIAPNFALAALLGNGRLASGNPDHVPAGKYGKAALETLGVWAQVEPKLARAENVRAALALVSRGEAPLGIVYATDAAADKKVRIVDEFPADTYPPVVYPAAVTAASRNADAGKLLAHLRSATARAAFEKYGFSVLE